MDRRTFLALPGLGLTGLALGACGEDSSVTQYNNPPVSGSAGSAGSAGPRRVRYGSEASQFGDLYLPSGPPRGIVVVVHGGFWLAEYDLSLGEPLAASLADEGWAAWNIEYRRIGGGTGGGGGDPETFDDVHAAIEKLADFDMDLSTVVTLGHSAGGHLGAWAASRGRFGQWPTTVDVTAVVSQSGVLDLRGGYDENLGGGAVERFLGHAPGTADAPLDPLQQVPLDVPLWCVHGDRDQNVPISQSRTYVDAATRAGAQAELVQVDGDHFVLIDPTSPAWARTLAILDGVG